MSFTDDPRWRRDPLGAFNTSGQAKCSRYVSDNTIDSHVSSCSSNPANQTTEE